MTLTQREIQKIIDNEEGNHLIHPGTIRSKASVLRRETSSVGSEPSLEESGVFIPPPEEISPTEEWYHARDSEEPSRDDYDFIL